MTVARFGAAAIPWTVSWTGEDHFYVDRCPIFRGPAIMQRVAVGAGKPLFSKPHAQRQREAIAQCRCDLCGKSIKTSTKVSLSHARPVPHGANGWAVLQVEPMLHRACAAESMRFCPALKRDIADGSLMVRQVTRSRVQCAIMDEIYVESVTGTRVKALGHAKVELLDWIDRDMDWVTS